METDEITVAASVAKPAKVSSAGLRAVPAPEPRGDIALMATGVSTHQCPQADHVPSYINATTIQQAYLFILMSLMLPVVMNYTSTR
jgi:hypothetical protein